MMSAHCRICDAETDIPRGANWDAVCPICERLETRLSWRAKDAAVSVDGLARKLMDSPRFIAEAHRPEDVGRRLMSWAEGLQDSLSRILADWRSTRDELESRRAHGRLSLLSRGAIGACPWCGEPESELSLRHWCERCEANACEDCGEAPAFATLSVCHTCEARSQRGDHDRQSYLECEEDEHRLADNLERMRDMQDQQRRERVGRDAA